MRLHFCCAGRSACAHQVMIVTASQIERDMSLSAGIQAGQAEAGNAHRSFATLLPKEKDNIVFGHRERAAAVTAPDDGSSPPC